MPSNLHVALRWNKRDPYLEYNDREYISWQIMEPVRRNKHSQSYTERDGSKGTHIEKSGSRFSQQWASEEIKLHHVVSKGPGSTFSIQSSIPIGTQWQQNRCAYDAIRTVLLNIWHEEPDAMTGSWRELRNNFLDSLVADFDSHESIGLFTGSRTVYNCKASLLYKTPF